MTLTQSEKRPVHRSLASIGLSGLALASYAVVGGTYILAALAYSDASDYDFIGWSESSIFALVCAGPIAVINLAAQIAGVRFSRLTTYATLATAFIVGALFAVWLMPRPL